MVARVGRLSMVGAAIALLWLGAAAAAASAPTTESNKALAQSDAPKLLDLVNLPPGSSSQSSEPPDDGGWLKDPGYMQNSRNLVDVNEFWHVPGSFQSTLAYIKAHPPAGWRSVEGSWFTGTVPPNQDLDYYFSDISGRVAPRLLAISLVQLSDGSTGVRADAEEAWIVTRPRSEKVPGGVREIDIREVEIQRAHPVGRPFVPERPILSLKLTNRAKIKKIVRWIDGLPLNQPLRFPCHGGPRSLTVATLAFRAGGGGILARASGVPAARGAAPCLPFEFSIHGRWQPPLQYGDVFGKVQRLLGVRFRRG